MSEACCSAAESTVQPAPARVQCTVIIQHTTKPSPPEHPPWPDSAAPAQSEWWGSQSLTMIVRQNQTIFRWTLTPPRDSQSLSEALLRGVVPTSSGLIRVGSTSQKRDGKSGQESEKKTRERKRGKENKQIINF